jgi:hypothetical protein
VKFAQLTNATPVAELGDGGQSMQGVTDAQAARLRARAAQAPASGNTHRQPRAESRARLLRLTRSSGRMPNVDPK